MATGKVSVKVPVDEWLCKKMEQLSITVQEGYPSRTSETAGLARDQFDALWEERLFSFQSSYLDKWTG